MAVNPQIKNTLVIATAVFAVMGMVSPPKPSAVFSWLGFTTGGIYLVVEPKPWQVSRKKRDRISSIYRRRSRHWGEVLELRQRLACSESLVTLQQKHAMTESQIEELKSNAQSLIEAKFVQAEQLTREVNDLQKLADEIAGSADREARIKAAAVVREAQSTADKIITATRENLEVTVFAPEREAHQYVLGQIEASKLSAIAQLERLQGLQEKTRVAIEKMKIAAQAEHTAIKKKLQEQAKAQFLREMERVNQIIEQLENQIKLLTTENQMLRGELDTLDEPKYPEGYSDHEIYSRGIIDFYKQMSIKLDYKLSFREGDRVVCRFLPREEKIGEQQLRKFHDRVQRKFDLTELPQITTTAGTIQFELRLREMQSITPEIRDIQVTHVVPLPYSQQTPQLHPELSSVEEMRSHLERAQQREFIPPDNRFSPFEQLTQMERDWVLWLWQTCKLQDQNLILNTVWRNTRGKGIKQGVGQSYIAARTKLHRILDEAGIERRRGNNDVE
jgi:hypothetical protein